LCDPASNTWLPMGSMSAGRVWHRATLLPSGKVLVVGGWSGDSPLCLYYAVSVLTSEPHSQMYCYGLVYLDTRWSDCLEPCALHLPLFNADENVRIAAKQIGS